LGWVWAGLGLGWNGLEWAGMGWNGMGFEGLPLRARLESVSDMSELAPFALKL